MNDRIKKFARECGLPTSQDRMLTYEVEKFAELIVKKCADIATNRYQRLMDGGKAIKEHFGVE
jgi:adenylate kinase